MQSSRDALLTTAPAIRDSAGALACVPGWCDIEHPSNTDRLLHAFMGRVTDGISPASLALAYVDWGLHLAESPGKLQRLFEKAVRKEMRLLYYATCGTSGLPAEPCIEPLPQDRRFRDPAWQQWPFNLIQQSFLLNQQWWHNATTGIGGVSKHHEQVVSFVARQLLDMVSPVNFVPTNPVVLGATAREGGQNFARGAINFIEDWQRKIADKPPYGSDAFRPGHEVAVTSGTVIYRNRLIELIQYAPKTKEVFAEPVLIVPAWIMKYYILDLSQHNSLVNYLVERGHTVFIISWHNPGEEDRGLGMEDYLRYGVFEAINAVKAVVPDRKINAVGYCLGGTLLSIAAAIFARNAGTPFNSITLLAAQTDFSDDGELSLYIDESQIDYLEDMMWYRGYLDNRQMAGAFQLLRSNDLVWSQMVNDYLLGKRSPMTDLMAWNTDTTRMPYRMHSEYLRRFFLNNDLAGGRFKVGEKSVALSDIQVPIFAVATESDHVAPWRSVYKISLLTEADLTIVLTTGGHNAGIVSEPGHSNRQFRMSHWTPDEKYVDPDHWYLTTAATEGSWWPAWAEWLECDSTGRNMPPAQGAPEMGYTPLCDAPGTYVHEH